jgi:D-alanyl-D-alanine carboxypeptidase/D-alanyl-D-alanine-endopeptidase (penicillin-binding protein 4)
MANPLGRVGVLSALVFATVAATGQTSGFCDKVKALTNDAAVAGAHWGVSVTTLDGKPLCTLNDGQLFRPASNNKLFTAAAALALMGPDKRFTTSVLAEGELAGGALKGNLKLVGGGDANFGSHETPYVEPVKPAVPAPPEPATMADVEELANQIVAKGVKTITGDIVGDDTFFAWEPYPVGWGIDDLEPGYGAPVSALTIHDSEIEMDVMPGAKAGDAAIVTALPDVPYYVMTGTTTTIAKGGEKQRSRIHFDRPVGSRQIAVSGEVVAEAPTAKSDLAIHDPAEYAALALKGALERRGVKVNGAAVTEHATAYTSVPRIDDAQALAAVKGVLARTSSDTSNPCLHSTSTVSPALATHQSPTLAEDVVFTMKDSQNLHAEVLMRNLGVAIGCDYRSSGGLAIVKAYAVQAGIAPNDLVLYDGSGLSGHDLVTPRSLTQLLVYATKQKWGETFKASLPVGGVDGTLSNRFLPPSTLTGKVLAKTGTLGESRDLSGYLTAASGQTVVFSVLVDNHLPSGGADRVAMDKIVEAIAAGN